MDEKNYTIDSWADSKSKEANLIKSIMAKPVIKLEQNEITEKDIKQEEDKKKSPIHFLGLL